jgi:iron complex outermembrane receptor protein
MGKLHGAAVTRRSGRWAAFALAGATLLASAQAQDESEEQSVTEDSGEEVETITVIGRGITRSTSSLLFDDIQQEVPGRSPQSYLASLPGVNVQLSDPFGTYEFGTSIRIRGFSTEQIGVSLDGVPLETSDVREGSPPNRYVESENLAEISLAQGSGDVTMPSYHALGGSIRYFSSDPNGAWSVVSSSTAGSNELVRNFIRMDTPALWQGGPTAYISGSRRRSVQPDLHKAYMERDHLEAKVKQVLDGGHTLTLAYRYNQRDDHDTPLYLADGTNIFPLSETATGDPNQDALNIEGWTNGRKDQLVNLNADFLLTPMLRLTLVPYYEDKEGYGVGSVPPAAARSLYEDAINPELGGDPARTDVSEPDEDLVAKRLERMGGNRKGTTAALVWTTAINELALGGWYEDYDFYQRRPLYHIDPATGSFDFEQTPIIVYYDRTFNTKVTQFYVKDTLRLLDGRLTLAAGSKGLQVERKFAGIANSDAFNRGLYSSFEVSDEDWFQPQIGATLALTDFEELFVNYAENFSSTPRNALVAVTTNPDLEPETSKNVDLGLRTSRGRLSGTASLYYIDYDDRILELTRFDPFRVGENIFQNVGSIRTYGAEFGLIWVASQRLRLGSTLTLNRSEFQDNYFAFEDADNDPATPDTQTREVDVEGEQIPDTPKVMFSIDASYRLPQNFFVNADAKYTGERSGATTGAETVDGYTLVNLGVGYDAKSAEGLLSGLRLTVNVYNLFDEEYWGVISPDENNGYYNYGNERTVYLTAEATF